MMFGTREKFEYFECSSCGTIQIEQVPDLECHYPDDYLSLGDVGDIELSVTLLRRTAAKFVGSYLLKRRGILGKIVLKLKPWVGHHFPNYLREMPGNLSFDSRILDFGCGTGRLLQTLHYLGFRNLRGADAFIGSNISYPTGVEIKKATLSELDPAFDLIMLNHSFEHLPEPMAALADIRRILSEGGTALIRMPVVNEAWKLYGADWVQLDPPRHLFLFTEDGFVKLSNDHGFKVEKIVYDSTALQFWGSEQYKLDIPLTHKSSHNYPNDGTVFSIEQIAEWEQKAVRFNEMGHGDQASFYLRKA